MGCITSANAVMTAWYAGCDHGTLGGAEGVVSKAVLNEKVSECSAEHGRETAAASANPPTVRVRVQLIGHL